MASDRIGTMGRLTGFRFKGTPMPAIDCLAGARAPEFRLKRKIEHRDG